MSEIDRSATLVPAVGAQVERGVRPLPPERGWLVEWRFNGIQWLYLWPRAAGGFSFTGDANRAIRFARREDAEAALRWARDTDARRGAARASGELLVTEHEWPNVELSGGPGTPGPSARTQG